jgi:hypothetical protein
MIGKRTILAAAAMTIMAIGTRAGVKIDDLADATTSLRAEVAALTISTPKGQKLTAQGLEEIDTALSILGAGNAAGVEQAFKPLGKGLKKLSKAAKKELSGEYAAIVSDGAAAVWLASITLFSSGDAIPVPTPEEQAILDRIGKKLRKPLKLVGKGKHANAVKKLGGAYALLLELVPDP